MDCSTADFSVLHYLPEFAQIHVHWLWCYLIISSSVAPFSFCLLQSFPASGSFPVSQLFASCGQCIGSSASELVLPINIQSWFPLGLTGLISLHSKELSRIFSSTTVWKCQFFAAQLSLWTSSHIYTWLLQKPCCLAAQSCPMFCNLMDCSPPGSSIYGILQARILEWVAIPFSMTGKTTALTIWTFVDKVMSLLFNMLSRFVTVFSSKECVSFNFTVVVTVCSDFVAQGNKIMQSERLKSRCLSPSFYSVTQRLSWEF